MARFLRRGSPEMGGPYELAIKKEVKEWWTKALLGEQRAAHPIFDEKIHVRVDGDTATLTGEVDSAEQADQIMAEVRAAAHQEIIVNHLRIRETGEKFHLQTVIAVFGTEQQAKLAYQAVASSQMHDPRVPEIVKTGKKACDVLTGRARAAKIPEAGIRRYLDAVEQGKVLLVDRVPEDDALRTISALEGSSAELVRTLPPEPDTHVAA